MKGEAMPIYDRSRYPFVQRVRVQRFTLAEIRGFAERINVETHLKRFYGKKRYEQKLAEKNPEMLTILITGYLSAARDLRDSLRPERTAYICRFNPVEQTREAAYFQNKAEKLAKETHLEHLLKGN
jgi:hypothetical protein